MVKGSAVRLTAWVLVVVVCACGTGQGLDDGAGGRSAASPQGEEAAAGERARGEARAAAIAASMAAAPSSYRFESEGGAAVGYNAAQRLSLRLDGTSLELEAPGWAASLRWTSLGRQDAAIAVAPAGDVAVDHNRASCSRPDGSVEWYLSGPLGIEQGFTLAARPGGDGELVLAIAVEGELAPALDGDEIALRSAGGDWVLRYGDLIARDALGRRLPSFFAVADTSIHIVIDDAGAGYPIQIDPLIAIEQQKLLASDSAAQDVFGGSLSLSGDTALVGASRGDGSILDSGSAYAFGRNGGVWSEEQELLALDGAPFDAFGFSVSLSSDTALVGAPWNDDNGAASGSAYVFVRSGGVWAQQAKLLASDAAAGDELGRVAVAGDRALVGAWGDDDLGTDSGSAYVFVRSGGVWTQEAKLLAADGTWGERFGVAVSLAGDTALVGAHFEDNHGAAYVFVRSGGVWIQEAKLVASDAASDDWFGAAVAVEGDTALIGAYGDDDVASGSGSAYVFVRSAGVWAQEAKLLASDGGVVDHFGAAVALSGNTALVGAYGHGAHGGAYHGSAYLFARDGGSWSQQAEVLASDRTTDDHFGYQVAMSVDTALVSATGDDDGASDAGSAYVFHLGLSGGESCLTDEECGTQFCVDGVCCNNACGGDLSDCIACSVAAGAAFDGVCGPRGTGLPCDDGLYCTATQSCLAGTCIGSGDPCFGADGDADCTESCDEASDSCTAPDPDGAGCLDDGAFCNGAEVCLAGSCVPSGDPCADSVGDADSDCSESCDEASDSCTATDPNGSPCSDGTFCTAIDLCQGGSCQGSGNPCAGSVGDGDGDCSEACNEGTDSCTANDPNGSPCLDDGLYCNGAEICQAGACAHGGSPCPGADGDGDCTESCDESSDNCTAPDPDGMGCDDNLFCNGADSCNLGLCNNHAGSPCPGPDGDGDCTESCNENADNCNFFDPNGTFCSDDSACTQVDTCQNGACSGGVPVICPAEDACHEASVCVPQSGQCPVVEKPNGTLCNDGDACTQSDYCGDGNCIGTNPLQCEPLDGCHVAGVCDPSTGECSNPAVPDGTPCPGGSCQAGSCLGTGGAGGTSHGGGGAGGITSSGEAGQGAEGGAEGGQGGAAEEEPFQVDDSGCGCSTAGGESAGRWGWWLLAAALCRGRARRRRPG